MTIVTPKALPPNISYKTIELKDSKYGITVNLQETTVKTSLKLKLNKKYIVEVKEYRAINIPDTIANITEPHLKFVFYSLDGSKMNDPRAALILNYTDDGKIIKLSLPNPPAYFKDKPLYPALSIYKDNLYTLPVNSGQYCHLVQKIHENHGIVEINHTDPSYSIELLG